MNKVSIICTTYNHEPYIRQTLQGFVMQQCNFAFEIVVHDDASTDRTADIIREYEVKYPQLFRTILQTENQYSKGVDIWGNLFTDPRCAEYIAICEGDDYWIDPLKLQKQVDFLEAHEEYGFCHTECDVFYQKQKLWKRNYNAIKKLDNNKIYPSDLLLEKILEGRYFIKTASVLLRKELLCEAFSILRQEKFKMGDTPLWSVLSQLTKFYYFEESMIVYRRVTNSASNQKNVEKYLYFKLCGAEMRMFFKNNYILSVSSQKDIQQAYNTYYLNYLFFNPVFLTKFPLVNLVAGARIKRMATNVSLIRQICKLGLISYYKCYFSLIELYRFLQTL